MKKNKVLIVATNHSDFEHPNAEPTGLWLSELTHFYDVFEEEGVEMDIVSPQGGKVPIDERSLGRMVLDKATKSRYEDSAFMSLLENTKSIHDVVWQDYAIVYFAGGHGAMWDFKDNPYLNEMICQMFEGGKIVSAVCHGVAALQNVKLSNGAYLISGKRGTGFPYFDEVIAGVKKFVPYNLQKVLKERGMIYIKAFLPLMGHVVVDGLLVTGQNPNSATLTAKKTLEIMKKMS